MLEVGAGLHLRVGGRGTLSVMWRPAPSPRGAVTDLLLAIPHLLLLVLIVAFAGPVTGSLIVALALIGWPAYARVVRGPSARRRAT